MISNDLFLLDQRRETRRKAQAPGVSPENFFNLFVAELVTQDYQLPGPEYLQYGVVDGSQDCGVDAVYTFVNGTLVTDDFNWNSVPKRPDLDLVILQAKTSTSFTESALEKWAVYLPRVLSVDRDENDLLQICNPALLHESGKFLDAYIKCAAKKPILNIRLVYATRGDSPSTGVRAKAEMAREALSACFRESSIEFEALGSRQLVDLARRPAQISRVLKLAEAPITGDSGDGYICLVSLSDYVELIRDPATGRLDAALFEANVREHEGETDVNNDIQDTLRAADEFYDFWWLNNGVTVVAEDIDATGKRLTLMSPQIVNGLQTSTEIFKYYKNGGTNHISRHLLVRVIKARNSKLRDQIVKATNSQNELPLSALRATETFQRDIEEFLIHHNFYYDRRRNYARTRDYDEKRVVSMSFAGHAVACTLLQRPDVCRRMGASMLNHDQWYESVFRSTLPLNLYLRSIWLLRRVQAAIVSDERIRGTSIEDWQYHVAYLASVMLCRKERPQASDIAGMDVSRLTDDAIKNLVDVVSVEYNMAIPASGRWSFIDLSGSPKIVDSISARLSSLLKSRPWLKWPEEIVDSEYAFRPSDVRYMKVKNTG